MIPRWVSNYLEGRDIPYAIHRHQPCYTMQGVAAREHITGYHAAKVTVAVAEDRIVLLVLPAPLRVDCRLACACVGSCELRLATEEEIAEAIEDCEVGAIPPLPHWRGVDIWMDRSLEHEGELLFRAGMRDASILLRFADWKRSVAPRIGDFARPRHEPDERRHTMEAPALTPSGP
jgi:Ala-tRNA(Pro) deacylase